MDNQLIKLADKTLCTGCGACVDACSQSCITMVREGIHAYPHIHQESCIGCQKCMKTCPSINSLDFSEEKDQKYYACWHKDKDAVRTSTSGGVGTALAEHAIDNGYFVAGVVLTQDGEVIHNLADNKEAILNFKGSKYVQSNSIGIYKECMQALQKGHKILFIGTPCQTEAIKRIVPSNLQESLVTCSIICHGVNSPFVWSDFRSYLEKKYSSHIINYQFRSKSHGWQKKSGGPNLRVSYELSSGKKYDVPSWRNLFHYWFGQHYMMRPSCFKCQYRTEKRLSDIVIGDFWNIEKVLDGLNTANGVSVLITTTEQGEQFLQNNPYIVVTQVEAGETKKVLRGFMNRKPEIVQNKEIQQMKSFEKEYCRNGFEYMKNKYPCPTYFDQIINKIKSMI